MTVSTNSPGLAGSAPTDSPVDELAQDVGVARVPGLVEGDVGEDLPERHPPPVFGPPRHLPRSVEIEVLDLSDVRGPAPVAQKLYRETDASITRRAAEADRRRLMREPAEGISGRPTKRDRREIGRVRDSQE